MESEPRRPGGPPGLAAVGDDFGLRPPPIGHARAVERVREKIAADGLRCERLSVSEDAVHRDALINAAGARVDFPEGDAYERCYVGLVDPDAEARWAHPAQWLFVPAQQQDGAVVLRATNLPAHPTGRVRFLPVS